MKINKEMKISVLTTDGKEMDEGLTYVFTADNRSYVGIYQGVSKKGALRFKDVLVDAGFTVMPGRIEKCFEAFVDVNEDGEED